MDIFLEGFSSKLTNVIATRYMTLHDITCTVLLTFLSSFGETSSGQSAADNGGDF